MCGTTQKFRKDVLNALKPNVLLAFLRDFEAFTAACDLVARF